MLKQNINGTIDVICEICNGKLSDYIAELPTKELIAKGLAWHFKFNFTLEKCSYCV